MVFDNFLYGGNHAGKVRLPKMSSGTAYKKWQRRQKAKQSGPQLQVPVHITTSRAKPAADKTFAITPYSDGERH